MLFVRLCHIPSASFEPLKIVSVVVSGADHETSDHLLAWVRLRTCCSG